MYVKLNVHVSTFNNGYYVERYRSNEAYKFYAKEFILVMKYLQNCGELRKSNK